MNVVGIILACVLGAIAVRYLWERTPTRARRREVRALLADCHGDHVLVERLLLFEMERDTAIGFTEAARRARVRLRRDRR